MQTVDDSELTMRPSVYNDQLDEIDLRETKMYYGLVCCVARQSTNMPLQDSVTWQCFLR